MNNQVETESTLDPIDTLTQYEKDLKFTMLTSVGGLSNIIFFMAAGWEIMLFLVVPLMLLGFVFAVTETKSSRRQHYLALGIGVPLSEDHAVTETVNTK